MGIERKIIGSHPTMQAIMAAAARIASTDVGVLIVGEKGTGKELLARYIHDASERANGPFVRVDCQEISGSWNGLPVTTALASNGDLNVGTDVLERARGGTLFLDHVSAFGPELQARLLASIVGGSVARSDVRLVAAREPAEAMPSCLAVIGLAVVEIPVPALRQRRSDIPVLVQHFLELYAARHGLGPCRIERDALVQLWQYDWPGNVRELETLIERVAVLNRAGTIRARDLPEHVCIGRRSPGGLWSEPPPPELA